MDRIDQYSRKMDFILEKISNLPPNIDSDPFYIDALFYRLQVAIDATMDIIAMLCKDLGIRVQDDYHNLAELEKIAVFPPQLSVYLNKLNGLRNAIVHKYNKLEEGLILQEQKAIVEHLNSFLNQVRVILHEKLHFQ